MKKVNDLKKSINQLILSLEDNTDGRNRIEKEMVYFLKLTNLLEFVEQNSTFSEEQEQYEIKIPKVEDSQYTSRIRVRKRIIKGKGDMTPEYILCIKANREGVNGSIENEQTTTEDMFNLFKVITVYGMKKSRYGLGMGDERPLTWEVDVFVDNEGNINPWVKVDLEIPSDFVGEIPHPKDYFEYEESILSQWNERTEEQQQQVKAIMESYKFKAEGV